MSFRCFISKAHTLTVINESLEYCLASVSGRDIYFLIKKRNLNYADTV